MHKYNFTRHIGLVIILLIVGFKAFAQSSQTINPDGGFGLDDGLKIVVNTNGSLSVYRDNQTQYFNGYTYPDGSGWGVNLTFRFNKEDSYNTNSMGFTVCSTTPAIQEGNVWTTSMSGYVVSSISQKRFYVTMNFKYTHPNRYFMVDYIVRAPANLVDPETVHLYLDHDAYILGHDASRGYVVTNETGHFVGDFRLASDVSGGCTYSSQKNPRYPSTHGFKTSGEFRSYYTGAYSQRNLITPADLKLSNYIGTTCVDDGVAVEFTIGPLTASQTGSRQIMHGYGNDQNEFNDVVVVDPTVSGEYSTAVTVDFVGAEISEQEGNSTHVANNLKVTVSGGNLIQDQICNFRITGGTAVENTDYSYVAGFIIPAGNYNAPQTLTLDNFNIIGNTACAGGDRTIGIEIMQGGECNDLVVRGNTYSTTFTILDDDVPSVDQPVLTTTYCAGTSVPADAFVFTGSSVDDTKYHWFNNNTAIGLEASGVGNLPAFTATNSTSAPISATIEVKPVAGTCSGEPKQFTITVNGALAAGTISGQASTCVNTAPSQLTGTAGSGGTGTYTYQWQSSPDNTTWTDISGATAQSYTPGVLSSRTYFRRQTTSGSCGTLVSNTLLINIAPLEAYWKSNATSSNWNNPANWEDVSGITLSAVPAACTRVHIPGNAVNYPSLDAINTPRTSYGDPVCKDIIYHFGAEVAQPQLLTYEKAYVDYNFGYFDAANNYKTDGDARSTTPMKRGQWYALAAPLKNMVSGDFSLGGYPNMWQQELQLTTTTLGDFAGAWKTPDGSNALELGADRAYAISVWAGDFISGLPGEGEGYHDSLNVLKGILEMPYFENPTVSRLHRIHSYDGSSSTFKYYNSHLASFDLTNDEPGRIVRGNEAYRFIFDGKLVGGNFKVTVPAGQEIMVGNPFISTLDFRKFYELNQANMDAYYRLYVDNVWQSYSYSANTGASEGFIAPLQAFFISTLGTPGTTVDLIFPPEMVSVTKPSNKLRASSDDVNKDVLLVNAKNSQGNTSVIISLNDTESKNVKQIFSVDYPEVPQIYTLDASKTKNVIQSVGSSSNVEIPIGIWNNREEDVKLAFSGIEKLNPESVMLTDLQKNVTYDVLKMKNYTYNFTNVPGANPNRFLLNIVKNKVTTGINSAEAGKTTIYVAGNVLHVKSSQTIAVVSVNSVLGVSVLTDSNVGRIEYAKTLGLPTGVYLITVELEDGSTQTQKVVVN